MLSHAAFEVCRAADVEGPVCAEKHVCVSHVLIMSGTTDSLEVEPVETSLVSVVVVVSTSSTTARPSVIELVEMTLDSGSSWLCVSRETVCV